MQQQLIGKHLVSIYNKEKSRKKFHEIGILFELAYEDENIAVILIKTVKHCKVIGYIIDEAYSENKTESHFYLLSDWYKKIKALLHIVAFIYMNSNVNQYSYSVRRIQADNLSKLMESCDFYKF